MLAFDKDGIPITSYDKKLRRYVTEFSDPSTEPWLYMACHDGIEANAHWAVVTKDGELYYDYGRRFDAMYYSPVTAIFPGDLRIPGGPLRTFTTSERLVIAEAIKRWTHGL